MVLTGMVPGHNVWPPAISGSAMMNGLSGAGNIWTGTGSITLVQGILWLILAVMVLAGLISIARRLL